jgi:hypothetical protein
MYDNFYHLLRSWGVKVRSVINFEREFTNGTTLPTLIEADDGRRYVLKCLNCDCNGKALFNELISHRLGKKLDIPMPDMTLLELDSSTINKFEYLQRIQAKPGVCFGSEYRSGNSNITPITLKYIVNKDDIPGLILFDQLILNEDRSENDGNLFFDKKKKKLLAIDHSHILGGSIIWDYRSVEKLTKMSPILVRNISGKQYKYCSPYINGNSPFHKFRKSLEKLTDADLEEIFKDIPEDWGITKEEIDIVKQFIHAQVSNVRGIMSEMKNHFEFWKGEG